MSYKLYESNNQNQAISNPKDLIQKYNKKFTSKLKMENLATKQLQNFYRTNSKNFNHEEIREGGQSKLSNKEQIQYKLISNSESSNYKNINTI